MSVFAICDFEGEVQVLDKTRYDAGKSFAPQSFPELTTLTIKPGSAESAISVFNADRNSQHLDWCFSSFLIDVNSINNSILFIENGVNKGGTVAVGSSYTLSTYAAAVATAMTAAGSQTYTASVSDEKITISAPTHSFQFRECLVSTQCFFDLDDVSTSITGDRVEYGTRIITVSCGNGTDTNDLNLYQKVYSEAGDRLFTNDVARTSKVWANA